MTLVLKSAADDYSRRLLFDADEAALGVARHDGDEHDDEMAALLAEIRAGDPPEDEEQKQVEMVHELSDMITAYSTVTGQLHY